MIALRDNYPLVRFQDGSVMNYDRAWLASAVVRAAEVAGYKKWWLTTHVTESISSYLQQEFEENIVTISRLEKAVQSVLQVIGYSDVARCFETLPPPVTLSLPELARRAGTGRGTAPADVQTIELGRPRPVKSTNCNRLRNADGAS